MSPVRCSSLLREARVCERWRWSFFLPSLCPLHSPAVGTASKKKKKGKKTERTRSYSPSFSNPKSLAMMLKFLLFLRYVFQGLLSLSVSFSPSLCLSFSYFHFFFAFLDFLPVDHSVEMMVSASREAFPVSLRRSFEFVFPLLAMFSHVYSGRPFSSPCRGVGINNKPLPRFGFMTIVLSLPSYCIV